VEHFSVRAIYNRRFLVEPNNTLPAVQAFIEVSVQRDIPFQVTESQTSVTERPRCLDEEKRAFVFHVTPITTVRAADAHIWGVQKTPFLTVSQVPETTKVADGVFSVRKTCVFRTTLLRIESLTSLRVGEINALHF